MCLVVIRKSHLRTINKNSYSNYVNLSNIFNSWNCMLTKYEKLLCDLQNNCCYSCCFTCMFILL